MHVFTLDFIIALVKHGLPPQIWPRYVPNRPTINLERIGSAFRSNLLESYAMPVRGMVYEWRCTFRENGKKMQFFAHRTWNLSANISKTMHTRWKIKTTFRFFDFSLVYNGGIRLSIRPSVPEIWQFCRKRHQIHFSHVQLCNRASTWKQAGSQVSMKESKCIDLEKRGGSCNRNVAEVDDCCIGLESVPIWRPRGTPWSWWSPKCDHGT
jgi:hypothetical protein